MKDQVKRHVWGGHRPGYGYEPGEPVTEKFAREHPQMVREAETTEAEEPAKEDRHHELSGA